MGVIKVFVQAKENENLEVARECERLYLSGLTYTESLNKAKEMYSYSGRLKEVANLIKDKAYRENKSPEYVFNNICEVINNGNR